MNASAYLTPPQRRAYFTAKTRELIAACGGIEAAAEICNRTKSTVARWQDMECADSAPVECISAMEHAAQVAIVSTAMQAGLAPRAGAHAPAPARAREGAAEGLAEIGLQIGRLNAETVLALSDGEVSPAEHKMLLALSGQVRRTLDTMDRNLSAAVEGKRLTVVEGGQ